MTCPTTPREEARRHLRVNDPADFLGNDRVFGDASLVHAPAGALPAGAVDVGCAFLGKRLSLPLLVTGMSDDGTERSQLLHRDLACVAEEAGIAFAVGGERAIVEEPTRAPRFRVRALAPRAVLLGNVGFWQARRLGVDGVRRLVDRLEADGVVVTLDAGQELIPLDTGGGPRSGLATLAALARALGDRLVVKETGSGLGPVTARCLLDVGVRTLDVSGMGAASFAQVDASRPGQVRGDGEVAPAWGLPTAAAVVSVAALARGRASVIASGEIRDGLGAATVLALGASLAGMAVPFFLAWEAAGIAGARHKIAEISAGLRLVMARAGVASLAALDRSKVVAGPRLAAWTEALARR